MVDPRAHDEAEAALFGELEKASHKLHSAVERLHREAGDKRIDRWTRRERWGMDFETAWSKSTQAARDARDIAYLAVTGLQAQIDTAEAIWREHGWSRYILCLSANGHIHNYYGCHTLRASTQLEWHPELSGLSEAEAVKALGPILCTHCYPSAPAEYKRDPAEWKRERDAGAKDAEKAAREAKKAAKTLTRDEQFKDTWGWVTTVAGAIKVLRDEREYHYYYGRGPHPSWAVTAEAATRAREVLAAREARHPGWGKTGAEIAEIVARADKKNRKEAGI